MQDPKEVDNRADDPRLHYIVRGEKTGSGTHAARQTEMSREAQPVAAAPASFVDTVVAERATSSAHRQVSFVRRRLLVPVSLAIADLLVLLSAWLVSESA